MRARARTVQEPASQNDSQQNIQPQLARRLGLFDATMIVMGGIIGSGIFINPYVVARQVHSPLLILGAWAAGGVIAMLGAFIYAELAALRPQVGGQYSYIREAYHPAAAFLYGWGLLLVIQTGGMAAVAVTFARYFIALTHLAGSDSVIAAIAAIALSLLTVIDCLGVRAGSALQSALMVMKILAIAGLVVCGIVFAGSPATPAVSQTSEDGWPAVTAFGAAMVPVLFAYGGWQTANFIAGEVKEPRKNLPRGLLIGVAGVILLYLAVNVVCVRSLGVDGLADTTTPASDVMRLALGENGARLIAIGIAISTLGFLSQGMLTAPRVYFAMADDGLFFKQVAWVSPRTSVPVVAIALQGALAIVIAISGRYEQILNYVVSVDCIFFGLSATCLFALRKHSASGDNDGRGSRFALRLHPLLIILFVAAEWLVALTTIIKYPTNTAIGLGILLAGIPVYFCWRWRPSR